MIFEQKRVEKERFLYNQKENFCTVQIIHILRVD
jgi:hypothetical protein